MGKTAQRTQDTNGKMSSSSEGAKEISENRQPRSVAIAAKGIRTSGDFANLMSSLMTDVLTGEITPQVTNAAVNAGGKLLKMVEMEMKYGTTTQQGEKTLELASMNLPVPG
jgi:hypothetical protein